ncbi:MAG: DUF1385 domain-containing protein [Dehalococcoidales bacterium]|nr:DUF1385 domain-containing protein [Dehalococcoidales bacterium]
MAKKTYYGGQAVIEGVMMRGKTTMVTAVRRPNGEIAVLPQPLSSIYTNWARKTPLLRGIIVLIESVVLGIQTLMKSANIALEEEEEVPGGFMWITILIGAVLGIALFFLAPYFLTRAFSIDINNHPILFNVIDGVIRLVIFLLYLWAVGKMKDIRRVFGYHGAEHKTVNAYEHNVPLEVEAVQKYSTAHVRCGTSFLFVVLVISIIVFLVFSIIILATVGKQPQWIMILSRIVLVPVIAAVAYELIYFSGRHAQNWFVRIILRPGLWLQALTTREPDNGQVEVAIAALKKVIEIDEPGEASKPAAQVTEVT